VFSRNEYRVSLIILFLRSYQILFVIYHVYHFLSFIYYHFVSFICLSFLLFIMFALSSLFTIITIMQAHSLCTLARAKRISVFLWMFGVCYSAPWLALTTTVGKTLKNGTNIVSCTFKLPRGQYLTYYLADLVLLYVIPLTVNCVLYALIGLRLYSPRSKFDSTTRSRLRSSDADSQPKEFRRGSFTTLRKFSRLLTSMTSRSTTSSRSEHCESNLRRTSTTVHSRVQVYVYCCCFDWGCQNSFDCFIYIVMRYMVIFVLVQYVSRQNYISLFRVVDTT